MLCNCRLLIYSSIDNLDHSQLLKNSVTFSKCKTSKWRSKIFYYL